MVDDGSWMRAEIRGSVRLRGYSAVMTCACKGKTNNNARKLVVAGDRSFSDRWYVGRGFITASLFALHSMWPQTRCDCYFRQERVSPVMPVGDDDEESQLAQ